MTDRRVMQCPECGKALTYLPNGAGHIIHSHPLEVACLWNVEVGHDATYTELVDTWVELGGKLMKEG